MTIDYEKLNEGLNKLTGYDLEACERDERAVNNNYPDLTFSKSFQIRLAARALEVRPDELKNLPLKDYNRVCQMVFGFLFGTAGAAT